ncbi:unnamed protein product [Amoebophrya sp. A120]|nr:unnamed protein product [Amoebophrya sp. A120]|eukprot:GSA120T00024106001.1
MIPGTMLNIFFKRLFYKKSVPCAGVAAKFILMQHFFYWGSVNNCVVETAGLAIKTTTSPGLLRLLARKGKTTRKLKHGTPTLEEKETDPVLLSVPGPRSTRKRRVIKASFAEEQGHEAEASNKGGVEEVKQEAATTATQTYSYDCSVTSTEGIQALGPASPCAFGGCYHVGAWEEWAANPWEGHEECNEDDNAEVTKTFEQVRQRCAFKHCRGVGFLQYTCKSLASWECEKYGSALVSNDCGGSVDCMHNLGDDPEWYRKLDKDKGRIKEKRTWTCKVPDCVVADSIADDGNASGSDNDEDHEEVNEAPEGHDSSANKLSDEEASEEVSDEEASEEEAVAEATGELEELQAIPPVVLEEPCC